MSTLNPIPKHLYNGFVYMWINLANNKKYVGSHMGHEDDGYIGSGVVFKRAIKKHGINQFIRIILEFKNYKDIKELRESESFYLSNLQVDKKNIYYNLTSNTGCSVRSKSSKVKQSNTMKGRTQSSQTIQKRISKMQGVNHPQFKGWYLTPNGEFSSSVEAAKHNSCSYKTIISKCKNNRDGYSFKPKDKNESGK